MAVDLNHGGSQLGWWSWLKRSHYETVVISGGFLTQQIMIFLTGIVIARTLGSDAYGVMGTLKSLTTFVLLLTPLGLDVALLKHAAHFDQKDDFKAVCTTLRLTIVVLNLVVFVIVCLIGPWLQSVYQVDDFASLVRISAFGLIFAADIQLMSALYRVEDNVSAYVIVAYYAQSTARLGLTVLLVILGGQVKALTWIGAICLVLTSIVLSVCSSFKLKMRLPTLSVGRSARAVLHESIWMAGALFVGQSMRFLDVALLAALTSTAQTGHYVAMSSVAQLIQIYPGAISMTLGPRIAMLHKNHDRRGIITAFQTYFQQGSALGGYLFAGVAVFGSQLDLVFGPGFHFSWRLALLLSLGWFVGALFGPLGYLLSMTGHHRQELYITTFGAAILTLALMILIPRYGDLGAAGSVLLAFLSINAFRWIFSIRILGENAFGMIHALPPVLFLLAALLCATAFQALLGRSFLGLILQCAAYTALAGSIYLILLAPAASRRSVIAAISKRTA